MFFRHNLNEDLFEAINKHDAKKIESLLKKGADVNATTPKGIMPLHLASMIGDVEIVRILLKHGANPNKAVEPWDYKGLTPLLAALLANKPEVIEVLLKNGADPNAVIEYRDYEGKTLLHVCAMEGYKEIAEVLLKNGADPDKKCLVKDKGKRVEDYSPIFEAIIKGRNDIGEILIEHGADVNLKRRNGWTPLHLASFWALEEIVSTLLEHGAFINERNNVEGKGFTPMVVASVDSIREMLKTRGGKFEGVNEKDMREWTPLHYAAYYGINELAEYLLYHGADSSIVNGYGETPVLLAKQNGKEETASLIEDIDWKIANEKGTEDAFMDYLRKYPGGRYEQEALNRVQRIKTLAMYILKGAQAGDLEVIKKVLEKGGNVNSRDMDEWTPLHHAIWAQHPEVAEFLIENGADVNAKNNEGFSPLHFAGRMGLVDIVKLLMEKGADVNTKNKYGETPLHYASMGGSPAAVRILIENGAEVNAKVLNGLNKGKTPLDYAEAFAQGDRKAEVVKVLKEYDGKHGNEIIDFDLDI